MINGQEKRAIDAPDAIPEGAYVVNEDYKEPIVGKSVKKKADPAPKIESVAGNPASSLNDPVATIGSYVEQFHPDLLPVHKAGIIGHHAGKILRHSEWKAVLLDELTRRA